MKSLILSLLMVTPSVFAFEMPCGVFANTVRVENHELDDLRFGYSSSSPFLHPSMFSGFLDQEGPWVRIIFQERVKARVECDNQDDCYALMREFRADVEDARDLGEDIIINKSGGDLCVR